MFSKRWFWVVALFLAPSLAPSYALADEPLTAAVKRRVEDGLVKPLVEKEQERSRFSRARLPPHERRVRVTQATTTTDKNGRDYLPFAIDVRFGDEWTQNDIVGCAYPKTGALFVKRGDDYRPADILLGKNVEVAPGVCVAGKRA